MKQLFILAWAVVLVALPCQLAAQTAGDAEPKKVGVKNVEVGEADRLLKQHKGIVVLDVRTPKEYAEGHIANAKNVDFYQKDFAQQLEKLDKSKTYLVHCAVGGRSAKARDLMKKLKFESVYHLEGGMKAWEKAGKPVTKNSDR